jgi:DNA anti-recombination protein RmuC
VNPLPNKNERDAFDKGLPATLTGRNEQKSDELSLSGTHRQPVPFFNIAGQFGAKLVQYAKPGVSKKVLAAMTEDPDPAQSLANIRKLLVGPTHKLHDAMFEEVITILEESDREVQNSLRALETRCVKLSHTTNELVASSVESRDQNRTQIELLQKEIQKSAAAQQEMLSEMFLVIDAKIEELGTQVNQKVEALSKKIEADMREATANQDRKMQELEAKCLANGKTDLENLETRLANLEKRSNSEKDDLREVFAGGFTSLADRLKALREN